MIRIEDNTFAAACYDQNSVEELQDALARNQCDEDMAAWDLTADEWRAGIALALAAKLEDAA